jgi:hypothetical protein
MEREARQMPILDDILDHEVLGREFKRGELRLLRRQIEKRFGPLLSWAEERLLACSVEELERTGERFVDAASLEELLG